MPVRAGEHSGWLGAGSLGSVAPGILMMKVISRNFFFFGGFSYKLKKLNLNLKKDKGKKTQKKKNGAG